MALQVFRIRVLPIQHYQDWQCPATGFGLALRALSRNNSDRRSNRSWCCQKQGRLRKTCPRGRLSPLTMVSQLRTMKLFIDECLLAASAVHCNNKRISRGLNSIPSVHARWSKA